MILINKKAIQLIPNSFIDKFGRVGPYDDYKLYMHIYNYEIPQFMLNPIGCPTEYECMQLKINYINRLIVRNKFIKVILHNLKLPEDILLNINSYIGMENVFDLFGEQHV
jgi:hypothetical protein